MNIWPIALFSLLAATAAHAQVTEVDAGQWHTCALLTGGAVKCWGYNGQGQLGDGTTTDSTTPIDVSGISTATSIALGDSHSCALLTGGAVKCWGDNDYGQLGDGSTIDSTNPVGNGVDSTTPVDVSGITTATSIGAGGSRSCALLTGGAVKCWGIVGNGVLSSTPVDVSVITTATSIGVANHRACALLTGGTIKCWGYNGQGELGDGTTYDGDITSPVDVSGISTATSIALGVSHSCAVLTGGAIKCWGYNGDNAGNGMGGQLGDGTTTDSAVPVDVSGISTATSIALGGSMHSCAVLTGGAVKCWGHNSKGELGDGTEIHRPAPVDVLDITSAKSVALGWKFSCALLTDGAMKCWGSNAWGALGDGTTGTQRATPVDVVGLYAPPPPPPPPSANATVALDDDDRAAGLAGILVVLVTTTINVLFTS